jgi:hypothetical protein
MKSLLLVAALVITPPQLARAANLARVKLDPDSANGRCLPGVKGNAKEILARNRVQAQMEDRSPVPPAVSEALAEVVGPIGQIGDGRFHAHWGVTYVFGRRAGHSFQKANSAEIHVSPGSESLTKLEDKRFGGITNRGLLAHELGHYVSNRDGFAILKRYQGFVTSPCYLTSNAKEVYRSITQTLRREEFAEVFAAYVTNPGLLAHKSKACEHARRFMADLFSEKAPASERCSARRASLGRAQEP